MTTRRTLVSLPALAALLSPSVAFARSTRDPIFSRIEAHRAAFDMMDAAGEALEHAETSGSRSAIRAATRAQARAYDLEAQTLAALLEDPPETPEGAQALAAYLSAFVNRCGVVALGEGTGKAFAGIAAALAVQAA